MNRRNLHSPNVTVFVAGMIGAVGFVILEGICRAIGLSDFSLPLIIGSRITGASNFGSWLLGFVAHLLVGGLVGLAFGTIFMLTGAAGSKIGAILGLATWLISGIAFELFAPVRAGLPPAPGFYAVRYGGIAFVEVLVLFIVYGALVGESFERAVRAHLTETPGAENYPATSPLADAEGQGLKQLEGYKQRRAG